MDEFRSIAELFRPLAGPEAAGLLDDAAFLPSRPGQELVITADSVVEGVHFLPGTPGDLVARKLLRVNLSDLAAKAADPFGYLLSVAWPAGWDAVSRRAFAAGLAEDQALFGVKLLGGDTVSTPGPMTASVTALGYAPEGRAVRRSGARPGDLLLVSGAIGDGWLGLQVATGALDVGAHADALRGRYELPEPRTALRAMLLAHASAALDVSDGLIGDLHHLAAASGVGVLVALDRVPLSEGGRTWIDRQADRGAALEVLASGGDDYELAFTIPAEALESARALAARVGAPVTVVGEITEGKGVQVILDGVARTPARTGWRHS